MITNVALTNFKCFYHVSINPKLLTVLIGPNGTGKSSVLQALLLLKQSVGEKRLKHRGHLIDLSDPKDLLPKFQHIEKSIFVDLKGITFAAYAGYHSQFEYHVSYDVDLNLSDEDEKRSTVAPEEFSPVEYTLKQLVITPAMRGLVRPRYAIGDDLAENITFNHGLSNVEEQLATNLAYSRQSEERLSRILERVTGTGLRVENVPSRAIEVKSLGPSGAVNVVAEGFGANSLILLLHQLLSADKGATVLIEEPEIHLHPKAQAELAEVLADTAKAEGKQIIMTTHSEHLVERLLLLIAEGSLTPDDLAIYSFSKDEKGECSASEIVVTENGQVEGGLTDFYANNLETLNRRVKSLRRPQ